MRIVKPGVEEIALFPRRRFIRNISARIRGTVREGELCVECPAVILRYGIIRRAHPLPLCRVVQHAPGDIAVHRPALAAIGRRPKLHRLRTAECSLRPAEMMEDTPPFGRGGELHGHTRKVHFLHIVSVCHIGRIAFDGRYLPSFIHRLVVFPHGDAYRAAAGEQFLLREIVQRVRRITEGEKLRLYRLCLRGERFG